MTVDELVMMLNNAVKEGRCSGDSLIVVDVPYDDGDGGSSESQEVDFIKPDNAIVKFYLR